MIVAEKGELLFVFNFHPSQSYQGSVERKKEKKENSVTKVR